MGGRAMTTADRITARARAAWTAHWLAAKGIKVLESKVFGRSSLLIVTGPVPADLADKVNVVHENIGGLVRRTWAARLGGCCVHWREC